MRSFNLLYLLFILTSLTEALPRAAVVAGGTPAIATPPSAAVLSGTTAGRLPNPLTAGSSSASKIGLKDWPLPRNKWPKVWPARRVPGPPTSKQRASGKAGGSGAAILGKPAGTSTNAGSV